MDCFARDFEWDHFCFFPPSSSFPFFLSECTECCLLTNPLVGLRHLRLFFILRMNSIFILFLCFWDCWQRRSDKGLRAGKGWRPAHWRRSLTGDPKSFSTLTRWGTRQLGSRSLTGIKLVSESWFRWKKIYEISLRYFIEITVNGLLVRYKNEKRKWDN